MALERRLRLQATYQHPDKYYSLIEEANKMTWGNDSNHSEAFTHRVPPGTEGFSLPLENDDYMNFGGYGSMVDLCYFGCDNGGTCLQESGKCVCEKGFTGERCDFSKYIDKISQVQLSTSFLIQQTELSLRQADSRKKICRVLQDHLVKILKIRP